MPKQYSRYVLVVDNLSSATPTKEVAYEFEAAGKIRDIARDYKARCAIIEFDRYAPTQIWGLGEGLSGGCCEWIGNASFSVYCMKTWSVHCCPPAVLQYQHRCQLASGCLWPGAVCIAVCCSPRKHANNM
eukprot:GHUV01006648.1.p1 GENE.GHUV01006648.1~~GHUV01006648.1.p1  ORF type:complete len:130 (+),score=13.12 GHUV01006648.1:672-1061(+)